MPTTTLPGAVALGLCGIVLGAVESSRGENLLGYVSLVGGVFHAARWGDALRRQARPSR